jgi:hypothetical protein
MNSLVCVREKSLWLAGAFALGSLIGFAWPAAAAPPAQGTANIVVRLSPDLAGPGPEDPVCQGCDLVFDTGDQLLGSADPLPQTTVTVRDEMGVETQQMTNANLNGRQIVLFAVDGPGNYEVEVTVPAGWELCPETSAVIQLTAADFDASGFARPDYFLWHGCQPPTETPTTVPTVAPTDTVGVPTATPPGYPGPGDTATPLPTSTRRPEATRPSTGGDEDDEDDDEAAPAAQPAGSGVIRGLVFVDQDGDGRLGPNEPGVGGATVRLSGPTSATTTTGAAGTYEFAGLPAGSYEVAITLAAGWRVTTTDRYAAVQVAGGTVAGIDFGLSRSAGARPAAPGLPATGLLPLPTGQLLLGLAALVGLLGAAGLAIESRRGRRV